MLSYNPIVQLHFQRERKMFNDTVLKPLVDEFYSDPFPKAVGGQWIFTDFENWGRINPQYFSFYREPFLRLQSQFHYRRRVTTSLYIFIESLFTLKCNGFSFLKDSAKRRLILRSVYLTLPFASLNWTSAYRL